MVAVSPLTQINIWLLRNSYCCESLSLGSRILFNTRAECNWFFKNCKCRVCASPKSNSCRIAPPHPILELSHDSVSWTRSVTHTQLCHSHKTGTNPGTRMRFLPATCTGSYNLHFWKQKGNTLKINGPLHSLVLWSCSLLAFFTSLSHFIFHWVLITANYIFP